MSAPPVPYLPTGTVTFVFTNIEGSTQLVSSLGDAYGPVLEAHSDLIRRAITEHAGTEVSTEGDAFFAVFSSALDAVRATADVQRALASHPWPGGVSVRVRMGLHTGTGRLGGDSYVGLDVHRAARIAAAGHGGQVLLSDTTRVLVEQALPDGLAVRDLAEHRLKDLPAPEPDSGSSRSTVSRAISRPSARSMRGGATCPLHRPRSSVAKQNWPRSPSSSGSAHC